MIHWELKNANGVSAERIEQAKQGFIRKIVPFKQEFEDNGGFVEIDFNVPEEEGAAYSYSYKLDILDFNHRVNAYIGNLPKE